MSWVWGTTRTVKVRLVRERDQRSITNRTVYLQATRDGTEIYPEENVKTDSHGVAIFSNITHSSSWLTEGLSTVTLKASFVWTPEVWPHYLTKTDEIKYEVTKRDTSLQIIEPTYYISPSPDSKLVGIEDGIVVPLNCKIIYNFKLKDVFTGNGLGGKTIMLSFSGTDVTKEDVTLPPTDEDGNTSWTWEATEEPKTEWTLEANFDKNGKDTLYNGSTDTSKITIGPEPTTIVPDVPEEIKVGEEALLRFRLIRNFTGEGLGPGYEITLTRDTVAHSADDYPKTTDATGWVEYPWDWNGTSPSKEQLGDNHLWAGWKGDADYGPSIKKVTIKVPKKSTMVTTPEGPTVLTIGQEGTWTGNLLDTSVDPSVGIKGIRLGVLKNGEEWSETLATDEEGEFSFSWTPKIEDRIDEEDTGYTFTIKFLGTNEYEESYNNKLKVMVIRKTAELSYKLSDDHPVPEASMKIDGWLLDNQLIGLVGKTIELYKDDVLFDSTVTSSELGQEGYFEFSFDAPTTVKAYTFSLRWVGDTTEWSPIQYDFQVTVTKEIPIVYLSIPHTSVENTDFRLSACLISYHGAEVGSQTLKVYDIDAESVVDSGVTDTDGFLKLLQSLSKGDYNWRIDYDGSYQLEAKSSTPATFYVIEEPDYTRPKFLVRLYDSSGTEKDISPLEDIISLNLSRSTIPEADTFSTGLNNKDSKYSGEVAKGDRLGIYLAYEPTNWSKVPLAIRGMVEEIGRSLSTKGETLTLKGQDYALLLKNRWITDTKYEGKTPHYILTDTVESIFKKTNLDTEFDFDIVAPNGWPNKTNFSFDKKSILDCLKEIRDRSTELMGREYEFFVVSKEVKPLLVFRPKLASPISCEELEVGKNVINAELKDVISSIKNRVQVTGAKKPFQEIMSFPNVEANRTIFWLEQFDVRVISVGVDSGEGSQKKEEQVEKDYIVNSQEGEVIFLQAPPEGSTVEITFEYPKKIICEGEAGSHWWINQESIDNNEQRDFILPTSIENVEELDKLAKAILLAYKDPILAIKLKTKGLFMTEAGYDVEFKYSTEGLDSFYKIVNLDQNFTKGGGFISTVNLVERLPDIGEIIAGVIGGSY